jgi:uncharacterized protein YqgV (UPF0045/DUF77 family)
MSAISVQLSVYPLRQPEIGPTISKVIEVLRGQGLDVRTGTMSTMVIGDCDTVFDGIKASFRVAAVSGDVVMIASISNCCPLPAAESDGDRS